MNEYTFENLIMNPETPGLESLIGKKVYSGTAPLDCLKRANKDCEVGILREIRKDCLCPFLVEVPNGMIFNYVCIIPKKEEPKPEYVPFKNGLEFFNSYLSVESRLEKADYFLSNHGIWLKDKDIDGVLYVVTEIWKDGVVLGSDQSTTKWDELLCGYTFIDCTPCGRFVKEL